MEFDMAKAFCIILMDFVIRDNSEIMLGMAQGYFGLIWSSSIEGNGSMTNYQGRVN